MEGKRESRRLRTLADLARESAQVMGVEILVEEDGNTYTSIGLTRSEIADRLGWDRRTIWMADHTKRYIRVKHPEIQRPIGAAAHLVTHPDFVMNLPIEPSRFRFVIQASAMRAVGFITSRTMKRVDLLIESMEVGENETLLRVYHLAPARRGPQGRQRWP